MAKLWFKISMAVALATLIALPSMAQLKRGPRTYVRGGIKDVPDTLRSYRDSVRFAQLHQEFDSLSRESFFSDSTTLASQRTDNIEYLDSIFAERMALINSGQEPIDTTRRKSVFREGWFMNDSMSLSKVSWLSLGVPGYGQIYNKQYWKLPILYGTVGGSLALFLNENSKYRPLKREYDAITNVSMERTPELDKLQAEMIRSNTRRQIYLGVSIASYLYFVGDAAVNYATNDVSDVKKATTLACIFPGAGQIYNKSYWKVPFVVGGFATMAYVIDWNNRGYQRFKKAYSLAADYEANPDKYPDGSPDEFGGAYSAEYMRDLRNNYRRNRDLAIILTGVLYVFQIVDAHVDAHLKDYDISDDLTMDLEPMFDYSYSPTVGGNTPIVGFNLNVRF